MSDQTKDIPYLLIDHDRQVRGGPTFITVTATTTVDDFKTLVPCVRFERKLDSKRIPDSVCCLIDLPVCISILLVNAGVYCIIPDPEIWAAYFSG